jgi:hypothetical protein
MSKLAIAAILVARRHRPLARNALSSRAVSFCVSGTRAICPGNFGPDLVSTTSSATN